jgi:hypothetical protein
MGLTIHYRGRAKSNEDLSELLNAAMMFAAQREWMFAMFDNPFDLPEGGDEAAVGDPGEEDEPRIYRSLTIRPHRRSEPVRLSFNQRLEVQAFTKTGNAPFRVHEAVVELLRLIAPYMATLEVFDESGLWETGDKAAAEKRFPPEDPAEKEAGDSFFGEPEDLEGGVTPADGGGLPLSWRDEKGQLRPDRMEEEPYG